MLSLVVEVTREFIGRFADTGLDSVVGRFEPYLTAVRAFQCAAVPVTVWCDSATWDTDAAVPEKSW